MSQQIATHLPRGTCLCGRLGGEHLPDLVHDRQNQLLFESGTNTLQGDRYALKLLRVVCGVRMGQLTVCRHEMAGSQVCQMWSSASFLAAKSVGLTSSCGSTMVTGNVAAGWSRMFQMDVYAKGLPKWYLT